MIKIIRVYYTLFFVCRYKSLKVTSQCNRCYGIDNPLRIPMIDYATNFISNVKIRSSYILLMLQHYIILLNWC